MHFNLSKGIVLQWCFLKMQRCRFSNRTSNSTHTGGGEGISRRLVSQAGKERSGLDVQYG